MKIEGQSGSFDYYSFKLYSKLFFVKKKMGEDRSSVIKRSVGHAQLEFLLLNYFTSTNNEIHVLCTCRKSSDNCYLSHKLRCKGYQCLSMGQDNVINSLMLTTTFSLRLHLTVLFELINGHFLWTASYKFIRTRI